MDRLSPDTVVMESSDSITASCEVMDSKEQSENHSKTHCKASESVSLDKLSPSQIINDMDTMEDRTSHKLEILDSLVRNKQAYFKSQQRGDPDLSLEEKKGIAATLFEKSPSGFLTRFGYLLSRQHLEYFHTFEYINDQEREEVEYHLSYLGASSSKSSKTKTKNRRYAALQKMIQSESYFSMEEMQARNPLLFEQLVGKYQTDEEKMPQNEGPPTDGEFLWMEHFAKQVEKERMDKLKEQQKLDEAGDDDDSSDETENQIPKKLVSQFSSSLWGEYRGKFETKSDSQKKKKKKKENLNNFQNASEEEKAFYLQEFQTFMYESFLSGNDKDFDYSSVDNNSEYDCVDMRERDEQDQYFDEESPDSISQADMDITESNQDELAEFCEATATNPSSSSVIMDEDEEDTSDRLTEDDVQNLKSFASSWADNHTPPKSERAPERTLSDKRDQLTATEKSSVSLHKVPVKKNHKIKITLKTKEV